MDVCQVLLHLIRQGFVINDERPRLLIPYCFLFPHRTLHRLVLVYFCVQGTVVNFKDGNIVSQFRFVTLEF